VNVKTAPMGWNSWDCYGAAANEEIVKKSADFMAKYLKPFGWEYICVDIQWSAPNGASRSYEPFGYFCMDEYSRLIPAENKFPSAANGKGFGPLADYIHSLGLKFGIHIMRGIPRNAVAQNLKIKGTNKTARDVARFNSICQWNPDMYGIDPKAEGAREYYDSIFELYASWGVDYIKIDDICRELPHEKDELLMVSEAIHSCGRDMVFSLSPGPAVLDEAETYKQICDMWRITDDFWDQWPLLYAMFERCEKWSIHTGAGHWPDADMLPIGPIDVLEDPDGRGRWTNFTQDELITMMTLWCIFRSPLLIGGEMNGFDDFTMGLLTNQNIIDLHTDARHAHQVWRREINGVEHVLWTAVCAKGGQYFAIFNLGEENSSITLDLADGEFCGEGNCLDLWSGKSFVTDGKLCIELPSHGAKAFLVK